MFEQAQEKTGLKTSDLMIFLLLFLNISTNNNKNPNSFRKQ